MGDGEGHPGVLLHHEDRNPLLRVHPGHDVKDLPHEQGGEAQGGLVQKEEAGLGEEGPPDGDHLLLPARAVPREPVPELGQAGEVVVDPVQLLLEVHAPPGQGAHLEVLLHREVLEDAATLQDLHDAQLDDLLGGRPWMGVPRKRISPAPPPRPRG